MENQKNKHRKYLITIPEKAYSQKEIQYLFRGLTLGNESTFQELYEMRSELCKQICQLQGFENTNELDIIQVEIRIASKFIKNTECANMAEKIALYRDAGRKVKSFDNTNKRKARRNFKFLVKASGQ